MRKPPLVIRSIIMKIFIPVLMVALVSACTLDDQNDVQVITEISKARADAFNNGDALGIAIHFTDDAVLMPPGQPSLIGPQAVENYYQAIFDEYHTELTSEYREVEVSGNLAYGRGYAKVKLTPKNGGESSYAESEYINILKKQADGTWKTTHDIWNSSD